MRSEPVRGEEGAFEVHAEDARAGKLGGHFAQRGDQVLLGRRDQRRLKGGDAAVEQSVAGGLVAGGVRSGEVDSAEAVHLQVDEAGHRDAAAVVRRALEPDVSQ